MAAAPIVARRTKDAFRGLLADGLARSERFSAIDNFSCSAGELQ
jgi:hypothetical protein